VLSRVSCGSQSPPTDPAMPSGMVVVDAELLRNAGRWFDHDWYLVRNPDVMRVGIDPLAHYLRYGEAEGRYPSPWFNPAWYRAAYDVPAGQSALEHFLLRRSTGQFLPCPALYLVPQLSAGQEAIAAGLDPFDRYLADTSTPERELLPDLAVIRHSGLIDAMYHRINPMDRYEAELDPALHYCRFGFARGLRPSTAFDLEWYAETNPAVAHLGINPLTHYILEGEFRNRRPAPWFDPAWYRSEHDVPIGQLALSHYLSHRHERTVSPNPLFDTGWYVERHGASIPPEVDPFSHYLLSGAMQDIDPSPRFDARLWRHRFMAPLAAEGQSELPVTSRNPLVHYLRLQHVAE
jgi:hypothetical protein